MLLLNYEELQESVQWVQISTVYIYFEKFIGAYYLKKYCTLFLSIKWKSLESNVVLDFHWTKTFFKISFLLHSRKKSIGTFGATWGRIIHILYFWVNYLFNQKPKSHLNNSNLLRIHFWYIMPTFQNPFMDKITNSHKNVTIKSAHEFILKHCKLLHLLACPNLRWCFQQLFELLCVWVPVILVCTRLLIAQCFLSSVPPTSRH